MTIVAKTTIRGRQVEAVFSEEITGYAFSEETETANGLSVRIKLFAEDMPKNKAEAIAYLHANY